MKEYPEYCTELRNCLKEISGSPRIPSQFILATERDSELKSSINYNTNHSHYNTNQSVSNQITSDTSLYNYSLKEYTDVLTFISSTYDLLTITVRINTILKFLKISPINSPTNLLNTLKSLINPDYTPSSNFYANISNIICINDDYLILAKSLYRKNVTELNDLLLKYTQSHKFQIYRDRNHLCLRQSKDTSNYETTALENEDIFIRSENKMYSLFSTDKIDELNFKTNQTLDQIIEIVGKKCYEFLFLNSDLFAVVPVIISQMAELDVCQGIEKYNSKISTAKYSRIICKDTHSNDGTPCFMLNKTCLTLNKTVSFIPNNHINFKQFNVITGQNSSGKTTFALNLIHSLKINRMGGKISAESAETPLYKNITIVKRISDINIRVGNGALRNAPL